MAATPTSSLGFQNFYSTSLSSDITSSATDIFLDTVPAVSEGFLVVDPDSTTSREIIYYTSKTATKVTCPSVGDGRGQGDTSASSHLTGTTVIMAPIAEYFEAMVSLFTTSPQGWTSLAGTITTVTANGNRSYDLGTDTDQTSIVSPGMRLRTTRTVAAPTQSTSLNGTSQYWSDTTVSGMTFTDDFVAGAWVKLSSYPSVGGDIMSRFNGTSGWRLNISSSGQIQLLGYNGSSANYRQVISYQSLPLNKWVHVSAQLDMSAYTATTTTCYVMVDGVDVPAYLAQGGTNPTLLAQAGDLEVGAFNGANQPFPGKIAQAFVSSAKITQANVRTLISQGLTPALITSNNVVSAYSFDGNANDLNTTNANNLTASGSATATNADSPFGGQAGGTISSTLDYGIVQKVTASTITVQIAEGCTIPTSGGVSAVSYSTYKSPYGFPGDRGKWILLALSKTDSSQANAVSGTWYNLGSHQISIPVGEWSIGYESMVQPSNSVASPGQFTTLSTANNTESDKTSTTHTFISASNATVSGNNSRNNIPVSATALTAYYINHRQTANSSTTINQAGAAIGSAVIVVENAYL